jgi:phosphate transport system substrate-binding protein
MKLTNYFLAAAAAAVLAGGCGNGSSSSAGSSLSGDVKIDGSGTVYPIGAALTELVAEEFPRLRISVGASGTGAGFKKFIAGETDISNASRPIKDGEIDSLSEKGIEFIEIPIAFDGLTVIVNPGNSWVDSLTVEQLNKIWDKDSTVSLWSDVDPSFPNAEINLYGPTSAHGTYEYFNEAVNGDAENTRQDYSQSAEYNALIQGVSSDENALGYIGFAYVESNKDKIKILGIDSGSGPIKPTSETIQSGTYSPLSRPLLMYVRADALDKPQVAGFLDYALNNADAAVEAAKYVPLPKSTYGLALERIHNKVTGSVIKDAEPGEPLDSILK